MWFILAPSVYTWQSNLWEHMDMFGPNLVRSQIRLLGTVKWAMMRWERSRIKLRSFLWHVAIGSSARLRVPCRNSAGVRTFVPDEGARGLSVAGVRFKRDFRFNKLVRRWGTAWICILVGVRLWSWGNNDFVRVFRVTCSFLIEAKLAKWMFIMFKLQTSGCNF
jgi:hypothetical protein